MDKKSLTETDIRTKFITPAITGAGWDVMTQIREEVFFTAGKIIVRGKMHKRGMQKFADYVLSFRPNQPIAIVELKDHMYAKVDSKVGHDRLHGQIASTQLGNMVNAAIVSCISTLMNSPATPSS